MALPKVAFSRQVFSDGPGRFDGRAQVVLNETDALLDRAAIIRQAEGAQVLLCTAGCRIDAEVIAALPDLRLVANMAVGTNNIDIAAATRAGVLVSNTPDVLTEATADMAWALLLAAARRVEASGRWLREGHWDRWALDQWLGADLFDTNLGIVGMGRIGQAIARRGRGFGMHIHYHNRKPLPASEAGDAIWHSLPELLELADHLVLVVPYSPATHHLIGERELALMKPGSVLVNIARGGIVDDAALVKALAQGRPAVAGLDVFENEPALHPGLLALDNAVLTPHIGSATPRTRRAMMNLAIDNALDWLAGQRPRTLVNPEAWR